MSDAPAHAPTFPAALGHVTDGERVPEAFGWAPTGWGLACLAFVALKAIDPAQPGTSDYVIRGLAIAAAPALGFADVWRRRTPKCLVRRGGRIALYRRGELVRETDAASCGVYQRRFSRTWGPIFLTAVLTVTAAVVVVAPSENLTAGIRLAAALGGAACVTLCTSLVRTRLLCEEALIPCGNVAGFQHVLVLKLDLPRLLPTSS